MECECDLCRGVAWCLWTADVPNVVNGLTVLGAWLCESCRSGWNYGRQNKRLSSERLLAIIRGED